MNSTISYRSGNPALSQLKRSAKCGPSRHVYVSLEPQSAQHLLCRRMHFLAQNIIRAENACPVCSHEPSFEGVHQNMWKVYN